MKQLAFLFDNIIIFYVVAGLVMFNTVLGVWISLEKKEFSWSKTTDFIKIIAAYTGWLLLGNLIDYFTKIQGYEFALIGVVVGGFKIFSSAIIIKEIGKAMLKLKTLQPIETEKPII